MKRLKIIGLIGSITQEISLQYSHSPGYLFAYQMVISSLQALYLFRVCKVRIGNAEYRMILRHSTLDFIPEQLC